MALEIKPWTAVVELWRAFPRVGWDRSIPAQGAVRAGLCLLWRQQGLQMGWIWWILVAPRTAGLGSQRWQHLNLFESKCNEMLPLPLLRISCEGNSWGSPYLCIPSSFLPFSPRSPSWLEELALGDAANTCRPLTQLLIYVEWLRYSILLPLSD